VNVQVNNQDAPYYIRVVPQSHAGSHRNVAKHAKAFPAVAKGMVRAASQMPTYSGTAAGL